MAKKKPIGSAAAPKKKAPKRKPVAKRNPVTPEEIAARKRQRNTPVERRHPSRNVDGNLKAAARDEIEAAVSSMLRDLKSRSEIIKHLRDNWKFTRASAREIYDLAAARMETEAGWLPAQIDHMIEKEAVDVLTDEGATANSKLSAAKMLREMRDQKGDSPEELGQKTMLWMEYLDRASIEQIDQFLSDFRLGMFDIRSITPESLETMLTSKIANRPVNKNWSK